MALRAHCAGARRGGALWWRRCWLALRWRAAVARCGGALWWHAAVAAHCFSSISHQSSIEAGLWMVASIGIPALFLLLDLRSRESKVSLTIVWCMQRRGGGVALAGHALLRHT